MTKYHVSKQLTKPVIIGAVYRIQVSAQPPAKKTAGLIEPDRTGNIIVHRSTQNAEKEQF